MARDPAMLWYWGDWNSGTSLFSRFLKGCYMDVLHAQFNNGRLSLEEIKICLGADFGTAWPTLQKKFKQDENGLFFNERLESEKQKRKQFTESRRKNLTSKDHKLHHMENHMTKHMENENRNTDLNKKESDFKTEIFNDWIAWGRLIVDDLDQHWHAIRGRKVSQEEMDNFLSVATRKQWKMNTQGEFRISLNGFKTNGVTTGNIQKDTSSGSAGKTFSGKYEKTL